MSPRMLPPMPSGVMVSAVMRNDAPVASLSFVDGVGEWREMHLRPSLAADLLVQLAKFVQQLGVIE